MQRRERSPDVEANTSGAPGARRKAGRCDPELDPLFQLYTRVLHPEGRFEAAADWADKLDAIPNDLIAGIRLPLLHRLSHPAFKPALAMMLEAHHREHADPPRHTAAEAAEVQAKRGVARPLTDGHAGAAVELLSRKDDAGQEGLFEHFRGLKRANAGAFFVEKSDGTLRVIVDAREGNSHMSTEGHLFQLFSVEALINVISNLKDSGEWYAVSTDWRHFFHQIGPLPDRLKPFFVITVPGKGVFVPRATPMGWILAPLIGQTVTWAALLSLGVADDLTSGPGRDSGLDPATLRELRACPAWLPLRGGGGIFVILDNVLVATTDAGIAAYWKRRIASVATRFNIIIKVPKGTPPGSPPVEVVTMTPAKGSFDFLGVIWRHGSRTIKLEAGQQMPGVKNDVWVGTHRHLAAALGMLLWYHRVHGAKLYADDMIALRLLYSSATPRGVETWETPVALTASAFDTLRLHWARRASAVPALSLPLPPATAAMFAAVDASDHGIGIVRLHDGGAQLAVEAVPPELSGKPIALKELHGIIRGCEILRFQATQERRRCNLFIIATDSMNAKSWVERQYAGNADANPLLQRLFEEVLGPETRLYLIYVPTGLNVADGPSRGEYALEEPRRKGTMEYLRSAEREAKGIWMLDGGQVGAL